MTLREKAFQLTSVPPWYLVLADGSRPAQGEEYLAKAPGHICNFGVDDPAAMADIVGRLQRTVVEGTRLGIPLLVHAEALNGFLAGGHMVFPTATGLAATWSPDLVQEMADTIRRQMTRVGVWQRGLPAAVQSASARHSRRTWTSPSTRGGAACTKRMERTPTSSPR